MDPSSCGYVSADYVELVTEYSVGRTLEQIEAEALSKENSSSILLNEENAAGSGGKDPSSDYSDSFYTTAEKEIYPEAADPGSSDWKSTAQADQSSDPSQNTLALGDMGLSIIRQIIAINENYGLAYEDYLFLGDKGKRIHIRAVDNRIRKLCGRAGIEPAKSAHDIRRTVATKIYRSTKDIELVRKYLGHSDVQTTWGYIIDIESERENREKVVDALSGFFSRPSEKNSDPSGKISSIRKRFAKKQPSALQEDGA